MSNSLLSYSSESKNGKNYFYITRYNIGVKDKKIADLFNISLEEYIEILIATGGYKDDNRGYIFNTEEEVMNAIVTLKILLE